MDILGYSERGLVSALLYDICTSADPNTLLTKFVRSINFPDAIRLGDKLSFDTVMVEPSFSDFGDADAVILGRSGEEGIVLFLEAKVKGCQREEWTLETEFEKFTSSKSAGHSSNLFTQLYHKVRLVEGLLMKPREKLREIALEFPSPSTKRHRKLGDNEVVLRAAERVKSHLGQPFYVALVPDSPSNASKFFEELPKRTHVPYQGHGWDTSRYGYACWPDIKQFCRKNKLTRTRKVFCLNRGQIY